MFHVCLFISFTLSLYYNYYIKDIINKRIYQMKKFDKSKIMKLAHHLRKSEDFTMSQALTLAWSKAHRDEFYMIIEVRKPKGTYTNEMRNRDWNRAGGIFEYYQSGSYNGD